MYITIDLQNLIFMHKVVDYKTACNLCFIEARHVPYAIEPLSAKSWLSNLTDMEMKMLYRNTTGKEIHYLGSFLRAILCELAYRLPETEVVAFEAERQAAMLNEDSPHGYEYVSGAYTPALNGYTIEALTGTPAPNEPEIGARGAPYYPARTAPLVSASSGTRAQGATSTGAARARPAQRASGAPRSSGSRSIIFEVADKIWEEAGKPNDLSTVLTLRREMMKVLESEHGVKKTTSSTALGTWQKQRIT